MNSDTTEDIDPIRTVDISADPGGNNLLQCLEMDWQGIDHSSLDISMREKKLHLKRQFRRVATARINRCMYCK